MLPSTDSLATFLHWGDIREVRQLVAIDEKSCNVADFVKYCVKLQLGRPSVIVLPSVTDSLATFLQWVTWSS